MKYLSINEIKHVQDLYTKNCETLMKEVNEDLNKWSATFCS